MSSVANFIDPHFLPPWMNNLHFPFKDLYFHLKYLYSPCKGLLHYMHSFSLHFSNFLVLFHCLQIKLACWTHFLFTFRRVKVNLIFTMIAGNFWLLTCYLSFHTAFICWIIFMSSNFHFICWIIWLLYWLNMCWVKMIISIFNSFHFIFVFVGLQKWTFIHIIKR